MQPSLKAFLSAAAVAFGLSSSVVMAQAPAQPEPVPVPAQAPQAIDPSEAQLKKYVSAAKKIDAVVADYEPRLAAASDPAQRQNILQEADQKLVAVVQGDGLTVDEYNGISTAVQQNPTLRQRVVDMVQREQGG